MKVKNIFRIIAREANLEIAEARLLTVEEAKKLPNRLRIYPRWWWLKTRGILSDSVTVVTKFGYINENGVDTAFDKGAVRPALEISNLELSNLRIGDTFEFGYRRFEIISDNRAFCLEDIGEGYFNHCIEGELDDFNDYEKSDIKKYVDEWFKRNVKLC